MSNEKHLCDKPEKLVFHGSFETKSEMSNVLLLLPKTKGPFGTKKFEKLIKDNFNIKTLFLNHNESILNIFI